MCVRSMTVCMYQGAGRAGQACVRPISAGIPEKT